jgi:hypothetical protein
MKRNHYTNTSHRVISSNWHVKKTFNADLKCLATIAILKGATFGQSLVIEDMLIDAMLARRQRDGVTDGVLAEDAREVIFDLYSKVGGLGSAWPGAKANKEADTKEHRRKTYELTKKVEGKKARGDYEDDTVDMEELAGQLSGAGMAEESEEDEDEVRPPGRRRGS